MDLLVYKWMELSLVIESKWSDWYKLMYFNQIWFSGPTYVEKECNTRTPFLQQCITRTLILCQTFAYIALFI